MKKEYMTPQMEAMEMKAQQLLAGSALTNVAGNGDLDPIITGGAESGRAPLFDDEAWDVLLESEHKH